MTPQLHPDLARLGDDLERAVAQQITTTLGARRRHRRLRSRAAITAMVAAGVVAVGGGAAAAVTMLSAPAVAHGMPGGSVIFQGTDPSCTTTDHVAFDCTLARPPADEVDDFTGSKQLFADAQNNIAGGCIGQDTAGLEWVCYAGQRAVTEKILSHSLLGQHLEGPAAG